MDISLPTGIGANEEDLRAASVPFEMSWMLGFLSYVILWADFYSFTSISHSHTTTQNILSKTNM
jgi:hypothetical protein